MISLKTTYQLLLLFFLLATFSGTAQINSDKKKNVPTGYTSTVSTGIFKTLPEFSSSHSFGTGVGFSWSKNRFGLLKKKPVRPLGFIADAGIDYYFGKKEIVSNYPYKYYAFTYIHSYAGIIYNLCKRCNINISSGPALGVENTYTTFFWGANLSGAYYINEKIAFSPGIQFMKDPESTDPLVACYIKASFAF